MTENTDADESDITRSEAAEYLHDISGQLSQLARRFGLTRTAEALDRVKRAVETEF